MSNVPDGLPAEAFCVMEGCYFRAGSSTCSNCGRRVMYRCWRCGQFTDESCACAVHAEVKEGEDD